MNELFIIGSLIVLNGVLVAGHLFYVKETNREKARLLNAALAKTPEQFRDMQFSDKVEAAATSTPSLPDLVPEGDLTDEEFMRNVVGGGDG